MPAIPVDSRHGVDDFEPGCAYIELAPWEHQHDTAQKVRTVVTAFETPRHAEVFNGIMDGQIEAYRTSAVYEFLDSIGRLELFWQGHKLQY